MSRFLAKSDALKTHLATLDAIAGIDISVNRQEDLLAQVNASFEKAAGQGAIVIKWLGGKNPDRKSNKLRMGGRFSISLWVQPILQDGCAAADDLIEAIGEHLHGWVDPAAPTNLRLEVDDISIVPDAPGYLVYEIIAEIARI